jgi:hypothetical protein
MAFLASAGLIFCTLGGLSCSFVQVQAKPDRNLISSTGEVFDAQVGYFGVQCEDSPFYDDLDRLWDLSQLFYYISLGFGGLTTLMAWSLTFCIPPTGCRWRTMSVFAAITAVMEVPIFLLFESDTCNIDVNRQTCKLAMGAYMNMLSVILWAIMTIWIQCLNTPEWGEEINAWKVDSQSRSTSSSKGGPDGPKSFCSTESGGTEDGSHPSPRGMSNNGGGHMIDVEDDRALDVENDPEIAWVSMNSAQRRVMEQNLRSSTRNRSTTEEVVEEAATRDANCMERILARKNTTRQHSRRTDPKRQTQSAPLGCSSIPIDETNQYILQGAADTVVQSAAYHSASFTLSGHSHNAVCSPFGVQSEENENGVTRMTSYSEQTINFGQCCADSNEAVNCVSQHVGQLQAAVIACILSSCDDDQDIQTEFAAIPGMPESYPAGEEQQRDDRDMDIDFLTKRMRSDMNALASGEPNSKVAPLKTIQIDTSYVQENNDDEMSEMTRGSGLASGVSEVLDIDRTRSNADPMTILDDLARAY